METFMKEISKTIKYMENVHVRNQMAIFMKETLKMKKKHGKCILKYANKHIYEGEFKDDLPNK